MTKADIAAKIAAQAGITKKAAMEALQAFFDVVKGQLKKGKGLTLVGFGTFRVSKRAAREGRNPRTGEKIKIPARKVPVFKPGKALKEACS